MFYHLNHASSTLPWCVPFPLGVSSAESPLLLQRIYVCHEQCLQGHKLHDSLSFVVELY